MLTAAQVAQQLGISERSVYALAAAKKIAHHRFGRAVRFAPEDVEAYREACRSTVTSAPVRGARVAHPAPEVRSGGRKVTHRPPHAPGLP